jgi:two-component system sensor histidine kinase TctE
MNREPLAADPRQVDGALRAQLSDIAAATQLMMRRSQSKEDGTYLAVACRGAFRAMSIVDDRALARRLEDEDERHAVLAAVDLVDCLRTVTNQAAELLAHGDIDLVFQTELTDLITLADQELVERLALCLISNGVKAAQPGGRVTVTLSKREKSALITVGDDGQGLPPLALERLCGDEDLPPDLTPGAGAGFGLRLARAIAETHGGLMMLESAPGAGTRAAVSLPLRESFRPCLNSPQSGMDGQTRTLTALADVLPPEAFLPPQKREP